MIRWRSTGPINLAIGGAAAAFAVAAWLAIAPVDVAPADLTGSDLAAVPDISEPPRGDVERSAASILSRPLFVEGRRAILSTDGAGKALGDMRLAGTITTAMVRKALFRSANESGPAARGRWVGSGEEVAGWKVVSVEPGMAMLQRGSEKIVLAISKRRALSPKEVSQARAATPIRPSSSASRSQSEIDARAEKLKEALSKLGDEGFYGTPD